MICARFIQTEKKNHESLYEKYTYTVTDLGFARRRPKVGAPMQYFDLKKRGGGEDAIDMVFVAWLKSQ